MPAADVSTPSSAHQAMRPALELVRALLGGTPSMRAEGKKLLPPHERESESAYKARLGRTTLHNHFRQTVKNLAAKPFAKPVQLGDKVPADLKRITSDIDLQGHDLTAWARPVFRSALSRGFTAILVDFPTVDPEKVRTLADEKKAGNRPYFVHLPAESILAAYSEVVNGVERLSHIRWLETETRRKGYEEVRVQRVRVWEPTVWEVHEQEGSNGWKQVDGGENELGVVPVVLWYAGEREGVAQAQPPLMDLAYKNQEHWQSSSDQRNVLTVARFPILAASGVTLPAPKQGAKDRTKDPEDDPAKLTLSPKAILYAEKPEGKFYYVEHTGKAIEAGQKDLEHIEDQMAMLGLELLVRRTGTKTATESALNSAEAQSDLQAMAESFSDALEHALHFAAEWMGVEVPDEALSVTVHSDFGVSSSDAAGVEVLFKAMMAGKLSREAFLRELQRRDILHPSFSPEDDEDKLDAEGPALGLQRAAPAAPGAGAAAGQGGQKAPTAGARGGP